MESNIPFPLIIAEGSPYDCGLQYGSQCAKLIQRSLEIYRKAFQNDLNLAWEEVLRLGTKFSEDIGSFDPSCVDEMQGIARGSGRSFEEITVLQAKTELKFLSQLGGFEGCTTLAALPESTADGQTLVGKNWDWIPASQELGILLVKKRKGGPAFISLTEAGLLARDGCNSSGICVVANALASDKWRIGVPLHIILQKALAAETMNDALMCILGAKRASSNNYLIAHSGGEAVCVEAAPQDYNVIWPEDGLIVHSNHFTVQNAKIQDRLPALYPNTLTRLHRANKCVRQHRGKVSPEILQSILRDHFDKPFSVCLHPDSRTDPDHQIQTNASFLFELNRKVMHVAMGPPCANDYVSISLGQFFEGQN
jgi:isopenicillin-N N-acyltransferase like protein